MKLALFFCLFTILASCSTSDKAANSCTTNSDCFSGEMCFNGVCVPNWDTGITDAEGDAADSGASDAETDLAPDSGKPGAIQIDSNNGQFTFDNTVVGAAIVEIFKVTYSGDTPVTDVVATLDGAFRFTGGVYPGTDGDCGSTITEDCTLSVEFAPAISGSTLEEILQLAYKSMSQNQAAEITLKGNGIAPAELINLNGSVIQSTFPSAPLRFSLTLENRGGTQATLNPVTFNGGGFQFTGSGFPGEYGTCELTQIAAGASCTIELSFTPVSSLDYLSVLAINYLDGVVSRSLPISLKGYGLGFFGHFGWGQENFWKVSQDFYKMETPYFVAADQWGNFVISDASLHVVHKFKSSGLYVGWIGRGLNNFQTSTANMLARTGNGDAWFTEPAGVAFDPGGNLYVVDRFNNRVQKWAYCDSTTSSCTYVGWLGKGHSSTFASGGDPQPGKNPGEFTSPLGIAISDSGNIFIADTDNNRIQKLVGCTDTSNSCSYIGWIGKVNTSQFGGGIGAGIGSADAEFHFPADVVVDSNGSIYISDTNNHRVQKWAGCNGQTVVNCFYRGWIGKGSDHFAIGPGPSSGNNDRYFQYPQGLSIDSKGNLFIADSQNHRVQKWSQCNIYGYPAETTCNYVGWIGQGYTAGMYVGTGATPGNNDAEFYYPFGINIDSAGNLLITEGSSMLEETGRIYNHRVQKWTSCAEAAQYSCSYSGWIGGQTITFHTGNAPVIAGTRDRYFNGPAGIAFDSLGNIFVADSLNHRVQKWTQCGTSNTCTYKGWIGAGTLSSLQQGPTASSGSTSAFFNEPTGVVLDDNGNLFVVDKINHRVQKWNNCAQGNGCTYAGWIGGGHTSAFRSESTGTSGNKDGDFFYPFGIILDFSGNLYISDRSNNRVQKWTGCTSADTSCTYIGWIGQGHTTAFLQQSSSLSGGNGDGEFSGPVGLAFDTAGNLYITDSNNARVQKWASCAGNQSSCAYVGWIGGGHELGFSAGSGTSHGVNDGAFWAPNDLVFDSQGNLYIGDVHRIHQWEACVGEGTICQYKGWIGYGQDQWVLDPFPFNPNDGVISHHLDQLNYFIFDTYFQNTPFLTIDSMGYLYISQADNARVTKFRVAPPTEE